MRCSSIAARTYPGNVAKPFNSRSTGVEGVLLLKYSDWFDDATFLKTVGMRVYHAGTVRIITKKLRSAIGAIAIRHPLNVGICVVLDIAAESFTRNLRDVFHFY